MTITAEHHPAASRPTAARMRWAVVVLLVTSLVALDVPSEAGADPGPVTLADGFNRADSNVLGMADTGQAWTLWTGSARLIGQQAETMGTDYSLAVVDAGTDSGTAAVTVASPAPEFWLIVRATNNGNYWRFGRWQDGAYQLQQVAHWALGSPSMSTPATVTPAAGDRLSCRLGAGVTCAVNGTVVASTNDGFNTSATLVGFAAAFGPARFDDVLVNGSSPAPDLRVAVTAGSSSVAAGAPVSWTASIQNDGTASATATTTTLTLPGGLTGTSVSPSTGSCSGTGTTRTCALGNVAVGAVVTITVNATSPPEAGTLMLTAAASASEADADPATNSASAAVTTTTPPPPGAVAIDGFERPDSYGLGQAQTGQPWSLWQGSARVLDQKAETLGTDYTLAVLDSGTAAGATGLTVSSPAPEFWLILRATNTGNYWRFGRWQNGAYQLQQIAGWALGAPSVTTAATPTPAAGDRLSCQLGAGIVCSVNGTTVATTADEFNRTASMMGLASAFGPAKFDDFLVTTPPPAPDLKAVVTSEASSVATGAPVGWTTTVTNDGTRSATATAVTLDLPSGLTGTTISPSTGTCSLLGTTRTCNVGNVPVGGRVTVTVNAMAPSQPATLVLTATASAAEADSDPTTNSAAATITAKAPPPPGAVVVDGFDRADSGTLGVAESGQTWSVWQGSARLIGQRAETVGTEYSLAVVDSGTASGAAAVNVSTLSPEFWLIVRATNTGNYWRFGRWQGGAYQLQQIAGWALGSPPVTTLSTVTPAAGDRLSCQLGTGLTCSVNGTTVASTTDVFNAGAPMMGFASAFGAARFDDLLVTTGAAVSWTATVRNDGTRTASATTGTVELPSGLSSVTVSPSAGTCTGTGSTRTCSFGNLDAGASRSVTVNATAPSQPATLTLTVTASAIETDADPSTNSAGATVVARAPAPPGTVVTDSFSRADSATLGLTETGQAWTTISGGFGVSGGTAASTGASGLSMATLHPGWTYGNYEVTVTSGAGNGFSVVIRGADAGNHFRVGADWTGNYRLWKVINGVPRDLQFLSVRADVAPRNGDVIRISNRPDDGIYVAVNGEHILDGGDTDLLGEGAFGLAANSNLVRFDGVHVSQTITSGVTTVDGFSDIDGTELNQADSGTKYFWRMPSGYWQTFSGRAVVSSGYGVAYLETNNEVANAKVTIPSAALESWLVFRYSENGSYYQLGHLPGGRYVLQKVVNDQPVDVAGVVVTDRTPANGDVVEVRQAVGGRIDCLVSGTIIASFTDTTFNVRATAYGIAGNEGAQFDDFTVTGR